MGIIESIKQLAITIGADVKVLRNEKANKSDVEQLKQKVIQIQDNAHQGQTPPVNIGEVRVFNVIWGVAVKDFPDIDSEGCSSMKYVGILKV